MKPSKANFGVHTIFLTNSPSSHTAKHQSLQDTAEAENDQAVAAWTAVHQPTDNSHWPFVLTM